MDHWWTISWWFSSGISCGRFRGFLGESGFDIGDGVGCVGSRAGVGWRYIQFVGGFVAMIAVVSAWWWNAAGILRSMLDIGYLGIRACARMHTQYSFGAKRELARIAEAHEWPVRRTRRLGRICRQRNFLPLR